MFPTSIRKAILRHMETENAMRNAARIAFNEWSPWVRDAIRAFLDRADTGATGIDADTIETLTNKWANIVDKTVGYAAGILYARTLADGYGTAGTTGAEPEPDGPLYRRTREAISNALGTPADEIADLNRRLRAIPTIAELQDEYAATMSNRMVRTGDEIFAEINREIREGLMQGEGPPELAQRVDKYLGGDEAEWWRGRAMTVARTESAAIQSSATVEAGKLQQAQTGQTMTKLWLAILDERTRPAHAIAHGQRVRVDQPFDVSGVDMSNPGDITAPVRLTANCRCTAVILADDEDMPTELDTATEHAGWRTASAAHREDSMDHMETYRTFTDSTVAVFGTVSDDSRMLQTGMDFSFRQFPLPLMWVKQSADGHDNAYTVGVIEAAQVRDSRVVASGYMLNTPEADEAVQQIDHGVTAPSVDLGAVDWTLTDQSGAEITEDDYLRALENGTDLDAVQTVTAAKLLGVTLVSKPAFGETAIALDEDRAARDETVAASITAGTQRVTDGRMPAWEHVSTILSSVETADGTSTGEARRPDGFVDHATTTGDSTACGCQESTATDAKKKLNRAEDSEQTHCACSANSTETKSYGVNGFKNKSKTTRHGIETVNEHPQKDAEQTEAENSNTRNGGGKSSESRGSLGNGVNSSLNRKDGSALYASNLSTRTTAEERPSQRTSTTITKPDTYAGSYAPLATGGLVHSPTTTLSLQERMSTFNSPKDAWKTAMSQVEDKPVPGEWFDNPNLNSPTPLTVDEYGHVYGTLATWSSCHTGFTTRCVTAPVSRSGYAYFHQSSIKTDRGELPVGRLTVGGGHAAPRDSANAAAAHYDQTGTTWAFVRAGEDDHGIWVSGVVNPNAEYEKIVEGSQAPLSGDWRTIGGHLELVAALAVNTPGFPVVASGATDDEDAPLSLVAALSPDPNEHVTTGEEAMSADAIAQAVMERIDQREQARRSQREAADLAHKVDQVQDEQRRRLADSIIDRIGDRA